MSLARFCYPSPNCLGGHIEVLCRSRDDGCLVGAFFELPSGKVATQLLIREGRCPPFSGYGSVDFFHYVGGDIIFGATTYVAMNFRKGFIKIGDL